MSKLFDIFHNYDKSVHPIVTHNIHPYPAKYPPHIPNLIINNYAKPNSKIIDPFMGSGTTVVESNFLGHYAVGNDINPLSPLIVQCKTQKLTHDEVILLKEFIVDINKLYEDKYEVPLDDWKGVERWFKPHILYEICLIRYLMRSSKYKCLEWFISIALSSIIVIVSNQDNDIRYCSHKKTKNDVDGYALAQFIRKLTKYIKDNQKLKHTYNNFDLFNNNALHLNSVADNSMDLLITSPPYANTNDYFLNHRLRLLILGLDYDYYRLNEIGSHAQFSSKKSDISLWNFDLMEMLRTFHRVLKSGSDAFIVIGDTVWQKELYKIDKIIIEQSEKLNFIFKDIYSYNLKDITRSFNLSFADPNHIKQEHIIHIQKR